jgi:hypothetical protein
MAAHVPAGTRVGAIEGDIDSQFALAGRYNVGFWETPAALPREHVRYVVVEWGPINQGYSDLTPSQVRHLLGRGRLVVSFWGRTNGQVALYKLPLP